ncbi:Oidioi.mRNA.OKI2018_I69.PAR.g12527.t1.cds [Oikopleura dioica]|uniref:Oidioi.mRNA.OKI2018_I69.PAR.g12527.t1.cds n=1 Tax=Oikopleura dioica TaxID=34765 RepID=A0ABN7S3V9_OIKDI|nr:Oidioi.mRNA.OKI2018_I69.PAR.g12527.t1.cds [Oikopleura dioica]
MIAPQFNEDNSPHRLMNPHQNSNAQRYSQNNQLINRSDSESSSSSSGSETSSSSDSSSDESGIETESSNLESNLVSLPSSNRSYNSNADVANDVFNSHANSIDPDMAMLHSTQSNTVGNDQDPTIPPPNLPVQPATSSSTISSSSSSNRSQSDGFKRTLGEICHRMVFQSPSTHAVTGREKEISDIASQLVEIMRNENPTHFKNFSEKLKRAFKDRGSNNLSNIDWFQLTFEDLIDKVVDNPTWRSLLNTLNCSYIVLQACKDDLSVQQTNELKSRLKNVSEKFIERRFRRYIESNGDWEGLRKYRDHVVNYQQPDPNDPGVIVSALGVIAGVVGALAFFRRS